MKQVFINQFGRIRSGWRAIIFLLAFVFVSSIFGVIIQAIISRSLIGFNKNGLSGFIIPNFILLTISIFIGWLCGRFLENLPFRALGCWLTKNWLKDLFWGLALGTISILFAVFIAIIFGGMTIQPNMTSGSSAIILTLSVSLAVFILGAAAEEALFRGYILQTFARANLAWLAVVLTSLFFASGHSGNPNAGYISTINTALAGVWFSIAYLKTRNLWLVFGLHLMWNWVQGAILGIPVSGIKELTTAPLFLVANSGSTILTGGDYGIEGGIACTIALIASGALIWFLPILKPTGEMLALTSEEKFVDAAKQGSENVERV
jgi:membrane protease YdiL (CAAX protease family)